MRRFTNPAVGITVSLLLGCGEATSPAASTGSSERAASISAQAQATPSVIMMDACDPTTFNAAVGPGTCQRSGGMTFQQFIAELTRHHTVGAWHFAPPEFQASIGQTIEARNQGGEGHSFTHVAAFGGGIVPVLNQLSGNLIVAPECQSVSDIVGPGGTDTETLDQAGTQKFQCCIHPWMRATVRVQ